MTRTSGRTMRWIAVLTAFAFSCATVRDTGPAEPWPGPAPRIALAEPQLELWMEGTGPIDPAESGQALDQSRDALSSALENRGLDAPDPDQLLVVHARAIARTGERKNAQTWSAIGIVFVVVALVVVAIVGSQHSKPSRTPAGVAPIGGGARPFRPGPWSPAFVPRRYPPPPPIGVHFGLDVVVPLTSDPAPWMMPQDRWLASRGWWDGDEVELTVELADPQSGAVNWHRTLRANVDPRDPGAMRALVDRALEGLVGPGTAPVAPPPAPPPEAAKSLESSRGNG